MKKDDKDFLRGFGVAVACVVQMYDRPEIAAEIVKHNGLCLADFEKLDLCEYDMEGLRKALAGDDDLT